MITASADGHVKFWKKQEQGVEFVKHFRAHLGTEKHSDIVRIGSIPTYSGRITAVAATMDGMLLSTAAEDKALKVFDILNFGLYSSQCYCLSWFTL